MSRSSNGKDETVKGTESSLVFKCGDAFVDSWVFRPEKYLQWDGRHYKRPRFTGVGTNLQEWQGLQARFPMDCSSLSDGSGNELVTAPIGRLQECVGARDLF
jgi:hypothetical protein